MVTNRFSEIIALLLITAAIAMMYMWIGNLRRENADLKQRLTIEQQAVKALKKDIRAERKAVKLRLAEQSRLAAENDELHKAIDEVINNDVAAKNWSLDNCPNDVLCLLKQVPGGGKSIAPHYIPPGHPGASNEGQH